MTRQDILKYLELLNDKLKFRGKKGEVSMVGGAVMCLCYESRASTLDIDAVFEPQYAIHQCAKEIAEEFGIPSNWINDGVSVYLSKQGKYMIYEVMSNLIIYVAIPEYMLAIKCFAARVGNQNEIEDIRVLLKHLQITTIEETYSVITQYYPLEDFKNRTQVILLEIFADGS